MRKPTFGQSDLPFGLPQLFRNSDYSAPTGTRNHYRTRRDAILNRYPRELAGLLDAYFDESLSDARYHLANGKASAIEIGKYALQQLESVDSQFRNKKVDVAYQSDKLRASARSFSETCKKIIVCSACKESALAACSSFAESKEVEAPMPQGPTKTIDGCLRRLISHVWWKRALRKAYMREAEGALRETGLVSKVAGIYASNDAVNRRLTSKARAREFLRSMAAINDLGEYFTLDKLVDASISNPKVRRSELMARLAGLESECRRLGLVADHYTLTTPSRFHCTLVTGARNPKFDGSNPKAGQQWLLKNWSQIRAKLKRDELRIRGIRVAEPHHDGTPHWHILIFCAPEDRSRICEIVRDYMLRDTGDEPGASTKRMSVLKIDYSRGTGASYLAKYVSKNIDGYGIDRDFEAPTDVNASDAAVRVETWASTWGIRQFQFFGAPPVGVWRELRRLREETEDWLEPIRKLVDKGDWAGFTRAVEGATATAKATVIDLWRRWFDRPGEYGDPTGFKAVGVQNDTERILTRERTWTFLPAALLESCQ